MIRVLPGALALHFSFALVFTLVGCGDESPNEPAPNTSGGGLGKGAMGPGGASNPKLKAIMTKVGRGPQALQGSLTEALKQAEPAWETIQGKTKEYARLATEAGQHDPPKGAKDSWGKLTLAFAESASELDKSAQAREKEKTQTELDNLGNSCMACHRQHRVMGPPGGGPPGGGPPGGFRPPPGYPGGSPPAPSPGGPPA
jgi:hypothetical protein